MARSEALIERRWEQLRLIRVARGYAREILRSGLDSTGLERT